MSDIAFFTTGEDVLKFQEEKGMYPPRFNVVIGCTPTAKQSKISIKFKYYDLQYDILLNPQHMHAYGNVALPSKHPCIYSMYFTKRMIMYSCKM